MEQDTSRASELPQPLRAVVSHLRRLPGAEQAGRAAGSALGTLGALTPRGRRIAVYTGAGVLGVAGLVEWPVAVTGAAVAWLTRPRDERGTADGASRTPAAEDEAWAAAISEGVVPAGGRPVTRARTATPAPATGSPPSGTAPTDGRAARVQPAKVGDEGTASALRKVAAATGHDDGPGRPARGRDHG